MSPTLSSENIYMHKVNTIKYFKKQYCICGRFTKISATIKDFKDMRVVVTTASPFNSHIVMRVRGQGHLLIDSVFQT